MTPSCSRTHASHPLWADLSTTGPGNDIFIDTSTPNQVTIRWNATDQADGSQANLAATLFSDGSVRFDYGAGNTNLTPDGRDLIR